MADAIECRGVANVISAYRLHANNGKGVPYYSVWNGNKLRFPFVSDNQDGEKFLRDNLDALAQSGTQAVYEIRFHCELNKSKSIDNNTPYTSSFTFVVNDYSTSLQNKGYEPAPKPAAASQMEQMMQTMYMNWWQQQMQQMQAFQSSQMSGPNNTEPDKVDRIIGYVDKVLNNGVVESFAYGLAEKYGINMNAGNDNAAHTAGMAGTGDNSYDIPAPGSDQLTKATQALERLFAVDKKFGDVLLKLADMAETNKPRYNMAKKML